MQVVNLMRRTKLMVLKDRRMIVDPRVEVWRKMSWGVFADQAVLFLFGIVIRCVDVVSSDILMMIGGNTTAQDQS
jgi:hypothetical protein